ncbi:MAG: flagellar basal body rod protein FlgB [Bacillota bacterium]
MDITTKTMRMLEKGIAWSKWRHDLIASNIANADTPGYKRRDLEFVSALAREGERAIRLAATHPRHVAAVSPSAEPRKVLDRSSVRADGNSVDIEREMAELAKNGLYYEMLTNQLSAYFAQLRTVITDGRR